MPCTAQHMRDIFSYNITPLDPEKYTPSALAPELADIIGHFLEQMEIEDAREEHKKKFSKIVRGSGYGSINWAAWHVVGLYRVPVASHFVWLED